MAVDNRGLTDADVLGYMASLSNWGRWGAQDQAGALNYLTPQMRAEAARLVTEGAVVPISRPLPVEPSPDNPRPALHYLSRTGESADATVAMDFVGVAYHGRNTSHIDALCHIFHEGKMYNGFPASDVRPDGAHHNAIDGVLDQVVGRGVLLDVPAALGRPWLEPGEPISVDQLELAEQRQGVRVGEGDILLVRTGRWPRAAIAQAPWPLLELAGLHASTLPWLHERRVAVLGGDGINDVSPSGFDEVRLPIHTVGIVGMGLHLLDNHDLEALAAACAARGRHSFFFVVAPLFLERGTGSPCTGLAMF